MLNSIRSQECSFPVERRINKPSHKYCLKLYLRMGLGFVRGSHRKEIKDYWRNLLF